MRFTDLLKIGAHSSIGAGAVLAAATVSTGLADRAHTTLAICVAWWVIAMILAIASGWNGEISGAISKLLTNALPLHTLPEARPVRTVVGRLWPLALVTIAALLGGVWLGPQVPGAAAGFALMSAVLWWVQVGAVTAVEERDGVAYYVQRTSPLRAIKLLRGPGLRRERRFSAGDAEARANGAARAGIEPGVGS